METVNNYETVLALDVGEKRIGVARAHLGTFFPQPLMTLAEPDQFLEDIISLCQTEKAAALVVGLPRGMSGQDTQQTAAIREFGRKLEPLLTIPLYWIDEALTSAKAEAELQARGRPYAKGDVDMLAATYILEDFITNHKEKLMEHHDG